MRLFVGVPLPPDVSGAASAALPDLPALRKVRPEAMHITLAFLGEVPTSHLGDAQTAVRAAAAGHGAFDATVDHIGRFPEHGPPRVVWVGLGEGADAFKALAASIRAALTARHLPFDTKPFQPHVTLARVREGTSRDELRDIADAVAHARIASARFAVEGFLLLESELGAKGPRYTPRAAVPREVGTGRESERA